VTRSFQLGAATRTESGNTGGSHTGVEFGGGYFFHWGELKTGPFASYTWQKVKVDSYFENNGDSSSMAFGRQNRKSGIATLGWQLGGDMGNLHPFARVAWQHESETSPDPVQAGLVTLNGTFTMPGFQPDKSWFTGQFGVSANLGDNLTGYAAYNGRFSDANQRIDSVNLGLAYTF
jgi:outer membrane lipase/esterase